MFFIALLLEVKSFIFLFRQLHRQTAFQWIKTKEVSLFSHDKVVF